MTHKVPLIGELKARRQAFGWSIKELGERCCIDENILGGWEHGGGSPRLDAVENWAAALGLKLALVAAEAEAQPRFHVDWQARRVAIDGTPVRLTPMEWKALERLAAVPGELVTHQDLFRHLYGDDQPYRAQSTAIRVLITKLRRLLPPLQIEAKWGRGYVISGVASPAFGDEAGGGAGDPPVPEPRPLQPRGEPTPHERARLTSPAVPRSPVQVRREHAEFGNSAVRRAPAMPARAVACRAEELGVIERFLAERGATHCPDVATIERSPLPTLIWDKVKRKWVRPPVASHQAQS